MPRWVEQGIEDYAKRMRSSCPIQVCEITPVKRGTGINTEECLAKEAKKLLEKLPRNSHVVMLDASGQQWTTLDFAACIKRWMAAGRDVSFLVGGSDGLAQQCQEQADEVWSFSKLTFPHAVMRLLLVEQLYRAWSVINRLPYHRE